MKTQFSIIYRILLILLTIVGIATYKDNIMQSITRQIGLCTQREIIKCSQNAWTHYVNETAPSLPTNEEPTILERFEYDVTCWILMGIKNGITEKSTSNFFF